MRVSRATAAALAVVLALTFAVNSLVPAIADLGVTWPVAGLLALLLLELPWRRAAGLAALVGLLTALLLEAAGSTTVSAVGSALGLAAGALIARWALQPDDDHRYELRGPDQLPRLLGWSVVAATGSMLTLFLVSAAFGDTPRAPELAARGIGTLSGLLLVLPLRGQWRGRRRATGSRLELWAQRTILLAVALGIYLPHSFGALVFCLLPPLVWGTIRSSRVEASLQTLVLAALGYLSAAAGTGPSAIALDIGFKPVGVLVVTLGFTAALALVVTPLDLAMTHHRTVAERARRHERTLQQVLDAATALAIVAVDRRGRVIQANAGTAQLLGLRGTDLVGLPFAELLAGRLGASRGQEATPLELMADRRSRDRVIVRADGEVRTIAVRVEPMTDLSDPGAGRPHVADGPWSVVGYLVVAEDVTDRATTELALRQALEREQESGRLLREADQVKNALVTTISHELRTPITSIVGYLEVLEDGLAGELAAPQADLVGRVGRNAQRLRHLVDDLLLLDSVERGELQVTLATVDLRRVVDTVVTAYAEQLAARHLTLTTRTGDRAMVTRGDRGQLERALTAIVDNAVKFTPPGGRVAVTLEGDPEAGTIALEVTDTGVGVPSDDQSRVFTRFFRSAEAEAQAIQGTGLGLSIAHAVVTGHAGSISLRSSLDTGTSVRVVLPGRSGRPDLPETGAEARPGYRTRGPATSPSARPAARADATSVSSPLSSLPTLPSQSSPSDVLVSDDDLGVPHR